MICEPLLDGSFQLIVIDVDFEFTFTDVTIEGGVAGVTHDTIVLYGPGPAAFTA